jgi:hypothetical protein
MQKDIDLLLHECSLLVDEIGDSATPVDKGVYERATRIKNLVSSMAGEKKIGKARMTGSGKGRCPSCQRPF